MWEKVKVIWKIPELRSKIGLTLLMLAIYRVGFQIQVPILDQAKVAAAEKSTVGAMLEQVAMLSASRLNQVTIFGLGIMPYISASIIFQLLASVYPPLEQLQKEGESGRKKINEYTRYATVIICLFQAFFYLRFVTNAKGNNGLGWGMDQYEGGIYFMTMVLTMTTGT